MTFFSDDLGEMDDPTLQVNMPEKILEEVLTLRQDVGRLEKGLELVRVEQLRHGKMLGELLTLCRDRAKMCGVVSQVQLGDRSNGGTNGDR